MLRAKSNPILASSPLLTDIDSCLAELVPVLDQAKSTPILALAHKSIDARLADLASRAQQEANQQAVQPESSLHMTRGVRGSMGRLPLLARRG